MDILSIIIDHYEEIDKIYKIAKQLGRKVKVGIRLAFVEKAQFGFEIESPLSEGISEIPPWLLVYFALRAAITEEILYRAYPIEVFLYVFQKKWIAYLIPVLIFTLAHGDWDIFNFILVFTAGSIFAWVYIVKRNLWINIIAHFAVNIIGFFILPLFMS